MKQKIRLNEAQLKKTIAESVKKVLREMEEVNPEAANWPNGVNPETLKRWQEEDRQERADAFSDLISALYRVERLYEVPSESDHPLEKAYELIYSFIESEGLQDEI